MPAFAGLCSAAFSDPSGINENLTGSGNELNLDGVAFQSGNWPTSGVAQNGGDRFVSQAVPNNYRLVLGAGETMVIYVSGNLTIPRGTRLNENGSPGQLLIIVEGSLTIEGGGNNSGSQIIINGFIYSGGDVNGTIDVGNNVFIGGALAAGGAITEGNRTVDFSPSDLNSDLFDGLCDVGVSISVNGESFGPVDVNIDQPTTLSVSAAGCSDDAFGRTRLWREVWTVDGQVIEQSEFQTNSTCDQSPIDLSWTFDSAGSFNVGVEVQYIDCRIFFGFAYDCLGLETYGSDSILVNVSSALTCFNDSFSGTQLNPDDWVTSVSRGNFTPQVVNGRLRMTEARTNQSTAATLQRRIPGAENLVILEFDYYAYGGNGADGIAVVLSDALVTPQPGSYGGSLGYAQRNNGDDGFAGGWLGIGLDEYGNFSNSNEGRQGGRNGRTLDSVAIRGAAPDYQFLRATDQLSPGIDTPNTNNPDPQRYRITIDSRQPGEAIVSVERDLTGTGNNYDTLIGPFNALNEPGQPAVPENFLLSLTGSTGGSTNIHELAVFQLCALKLEPVGEQVDHFEIVHDGIALTCQPETVSIRACANADCSQLFTDPVSATLAPTEGWQGGNTVSLNNGVGQATLSNKTAEVVTLDVIGSQPSARPQSVTLCEEAGAPPSANACTLTFVDSGLAFDVPDLIASRPEQNIQVRAVRRSNETEACVPAFENVDREVEFWSTYLNPGPGGRPVSRPVSVDGATISGDSATPTTRTLSFGAGGVAEIDVTYPDAGQLQLDARYEGSPATGDDGLVMPGADLFSSRPAGLCVTTLGACAAADGTCPTFVKADEPFDLSIQAVGWQSDSDSDFCSGNPTTPNFALQNIGLASELVEPSAGVAGDFEPVSYDHVPSANATTVVSSKVSEVGVFRFIATPDAAAYFGQTVPEGTSVEAGRFYPDRFNVTVDSGSFGTECTGSTVNPVPFTYSGQTFGWDMRPRIEIEPLSLEGARTENYANPAFSDPSDLAFQKLTLSDVARGAEPVSDSEALDANGGPLSVSVSQGAGSLNAIAPGLLEFEFNANDTATYVKSTDARVAPILDPRIQFVIDSIVDSDGVTATGAPFNIEPVMDFDIFYGRLEMENVYGPENLPGSLPMPFRVEYWDGSEFVLNDADSCTGWDTANITDTEVYHTLEADSGMFTEGQGGPLQLTPNGTTSADPTDTLTWDVPIWLQSDFNGDGVLENPVGLATFGVYRGNDRVIYWEER